jgi:cyclophilin family peptidyl-prolyl cis-trans isomerase
LIKAGGSPGVPEPSRPDKLSAQSGYFVYVDLTKMYPDLLKPGQYSVRWSADGLSSDTIVVRMIPKYDPTKHYLGKVETDEGTFTIDFFAQTAPVAVKAFVDMSNAGFYDGLTFHKIVPDYYVEAGDTAGDGSGRPPFTYVAELSSIPVVAGTVLLKPVSPSPPANGSQFLVMLRPETSWTGQATVLGQIVEGLDILKKISKLPSSQQSSKPHFKPLKDVRIRKITIVEKPPQPAS